MRNAGIGIVKFGIVAIVAGAALTSLGCGDGTRASVTGKVTANGEAVDSGILSFAPIGGGAKPAMVAVKPDGTYDLSGDGVPIGKNNLTYMPPSAEYPEGFEPKPGDIPTPSKWHGMKATVTEVEVKAGSQTIDIELTK